MTRSPPGSVVVATAGPIATSNVGAIIALVAGVAPFAQLLGVDETAVREVFQSWGPGKFDAELLSRGKPFSTRRAQLRELDSSGLRAHRREPTYLRRLGLRSRVDAFVAVLEMQGKGTFFDPRLDDAAKFPIAAANHFGDVRREPDRVDAEARQRCTSISSRCRRRIRHRGSFDPRRGATRREAVRRGRQGAVRALSCAATLHRAWRELHKPEESRHRRFPGEARARTTATGPRL